MPVPTSAPTPLVRHTVVENIELHQLNSPVLRMGTAYWRSLCGDRRLPAREQIDPRDIRSLLNHLVLVKVIEAGADFDHRILGDAVARAYRVRGLHRKLGEIAAEAPQLCDRLRRVYAAVVETRAPLALRIQIGVDSPDVAYSASEAAFLPLGPSDDIVDHVMGFATFTLSPV